MKKYNYNKLKGRMREWGYTQEEFAKAIGICTVSLNRKLGNKQDFRQGEILRSCEVLNIFADEIPDYFFNPEL
nr:MAG TPA: Protein of unknown function (DUF739) [Caudoviricetes sp.]